MKKTPLPLTWQFHFPSGESAGAQDWLKELTEMRGRVLYEGGRRPEFRRVDGNFADPDLLDIYAYHLLAWSSSCLVGCCRVVPLASTPTCITEWLLGRQRFDQLLSEIGTTRARSCEASRWIVAPEYRCITLGLRLVAGMYAIARWLGLQTGIATVGTRNGQDRALIRTGGRPVPGLVPLASQRFDDEMVVLSFNPWSPAKSFAVLVKEMAALLQFEHQSLEVETNIYEADILLESDAS